MISRAADPDRPGQPGVLRVVQAEHRHRRDALAGAGLPDDAERLAALDGVGEVGDGLDQAVVGRELDGQVLDDQERVVGVGRRRHVSGAR